MSAYYRFLGRGFPVICHPFSDSVRSRWHCEVKGASLSNSALDPDPAVVRLDYPSRNCEPKSCRSLSCPTTGMPKPVEYMWNGVNRNPASGVSNGNLDGIWQHGGAHDDTPAGIREFAGVANQIREHLYNTLAVDHHGDLIHFRRHIGRHGNALFDPDQPMHIDRSPKRWADCLPYTVDG